MNEDELNAIVDAKLAEQLAARVAADRERVRTEVILKMRRDAERAHHAKINARHPIQSKLAGLTQAQEDERQRQMAERTAATNARMDAANARPVSGQVVRGLRPTRADGAGGQVGFRVKG
jgi:hypothetical protein